MDSSQRQQLTTLGIVTTTIAGNNSLQAGPDGDRVTGEPDQFSVQVEHTWAEPEINLVIKNISPQVTTITNIVPPQINTDPGLFDMQQVMGKKSLTLQPGEEFRVPLEQGSQETGTYSHFDCSLQQTVQAKLQIDTQRTERASVTTLFNPRLV